MWKEKWYAPVFYLFMIYISWRRNPERITGDLWICPKDYHVTCVQRHLQVGVAFSITSRSTLGLRSTVAQSVTSRLFRVAIWRGTPSFTVGRHHKTAHIATIPVMMLPTSKGISRCTPGKNCTIAINVNMKQQMQATCKGTRRRTLVKSHRGAHHAIIQASQLVHWMFT